MRIFERPREYDFGSLFGGSKSEGNEVSNVTLKPFVTDPLYTSSQDQLNKLGTNLINGVPLTGNNANIGVSNSPAFQAMLNGIKGQTMQGAQEAAAINGTGRSGTAVTASNQALNQIIPKLTYQDFLNAQNQQIGLFNTGVNVQQGVRGAAQNEASQQNSYNEFLNGFQMDQAQYDNTYNANRAAQKGQAIGSVIQDALAIGAAPFTGGASLAALNFGGGGVGGTGTPSSGQNLNSIISGLGSFFKGGNSSGGSSDMFSMMQEAGLL